MGDFTVIGIVSELLKNLLQEDFTAIFSGSSFSVGSVRLASPKEMEGTENAALSLFLYQITENGHMRNQPMERIDSAMFRFPPLFLNCYYLLTPYGSKESEEFAGFDEHTILGRAMQVLHDNGSLEGPVLSALLTASGYGDYSDRLKQVRIILNSISLDDLTKIWGSLDTTMRLSVAYEVRVLMIASERTRSTRRIIEKEANYYQIG